MIRNRDTQNVRNGRQAELLPLRRPPASPAEQAERAHRAWLLLALAEDRAECAPFFKVPADG